MVGERIGNYRVVRRLGEGGMGVVYEAVRDDIGSRVAIKVLRSEFAMNTEIAARFFNEARAANLIEHPGIVKIFDYGQMPTGAAYLAMELLSGESLHERIVRERQLSEPDTIRIGRQMAMALAAAHAKRVIHRDLKPENVFLVSDAEAPSGERAKILDFGIAKLAREQTGAVRTDTNVVMGTPIYMSPEQCRGGKKVGERADVYALGVMLFEMLAGRPPFIAEESGEYIGMHLFKEPPTLGSIVPTATPKFQRLVDSMLIKDPQQRPPMAIVAVVLKELSSLSTDVVSISALAKEAEVEKQTLGDIGALAATEAGLAAPRAPVPSPPSSVPPSPDRIPIGNQVLSPANAALRRSIDPLGDTFPDRDGPLQTRSVLPIVQLPSSPSRGPVEEITAPAQGQPPPKQFLSPLFPVIRIAADAQPAPRPVEPQRAGGGPELPTPILSMRPEWQQVQVIAASSVAFDKLDPDSLIPEPGPSVQRGRSFGRRLRRIRFRIKKRLLGWLGISLADQRSTPAKNPAPGRRNAVLVVTLALAIGACVVFLIKSNPATPADPTPVFKPAPPPAPPPVLAPNPSPAVELDKQVPKEDSLPPLPEDLAAELKATGARVDAGQVVAALKEARATAKQYKHPAAWSAMGRYACRAGKLKLANEALGHLSKNDVISVHARGELLVACQQEGVSLADNGRFKQLN